MRTKCRERIKIENMAVGAMEYFRKGKVVPVDGYVRRINKSLLENEKIRKKKNKTGENPFRLFIKSCDRYKEGFISVKRNY